MNSRTPLRWVSSHPARCRLEWLIERFREDGTYELKGAY